MNALRAPIRQRLSDERGQSLVLIALLLVVLLGAAALAVDVGLLMVAKARLQVALDAAVLAAAQDLPNTGQARSTFSSYVSSNYEVSALFPAPATTPQFSTTGGAAAVNTVTATGVVVAPLHFARVFGVGTAVVGAAASAANVDPDLALIIDRSGSMCDDYPGQQNGAVCPSGYAWQPMTDVKNAARGFVSVLGDDTMMAIVSYNQSATLNTPLSHLGSAYAGINSIAPGGYTGIDSAIDTAAAALLGSHRPNPKVMVLLTDGRPNSCDGHYYGDYNRGGQCARQAADEAAHAGIIIVTIRFGAIAGSGASCTCASGSSGNSCREVADLMGDIAAVGQGTSYCARDATALSSAFAEIASTRWAQLVPVD
jgi:Flp pilus assembly protein TadG